MVSLIKNILVFSGAVKDGCDNKLDWENTEVTLLKHASVINMCVSLDEEFLGHSTCLLHQRNNVCMHNL